MIVDAGVRVFVEEEAAAVLADTSADAAVDDSGRMQFAVGPRPGSATV